MTWPFHPGLGGEAEGEGVGGRETVTALVLDDQEGGMRGQSHWWELNVMFILPLLHLSERVASPPILQMFRNSVIKALTAWFCLF